MTSNPSHFAVALDGPAGAGIGGGYQKFRGHESDSAAGDDVGAESE